ncbi:MAG: phosphoglucosamine mutase [Bacillota bacterium]|nr:phosphoglucosamine mutase [Bacillota bacterium]
MGRLFGTDGVRGVANADLTPELAFRLGRAGAAVLARHTLDQNRRPRVLIGRDTRLSGTMLESALIAGLTSVGADVVPVGVIPTPGVAYLVRRLRMDAGVMVSASHNPVEDNGIKFFSGDGYKLSDELEDEIEAQLGREGGGDGLPRPVGEGVGRARPEPRAEEGYIAFLAGTVPGRLEGFKVVLDCAFGASYHVGPAVFARLGAEVTALNAEPDGSRINVGCGSTHPEKLQRAVRERRADLGFAFDGDADRVIAVDERGEVVDGDHLLAIAGLERLRQGTLPQRRIAATVYSNLGLVEAFRKAGGDVTITKAGDRYVLEAMRQGGLVLGGEQSGHVIFLDYNTTGDGVLTALQLTAILKRTGQSLSEAAQVMRTFPQLLRNVRVAAKERLAESDRVKEAVAAAEGLLGGEGRIFVRPSGTEPLVRVLGEGPEEGVVRQAVELVAAAVAEDLGGE